MADRQAKSIMPDWMKDPAWTPPQPLWEMEEAAQKPEAAAGVKHDEGKPAYQLLPPDALRAAAEVMADGAKKYGDRNWENGLAHSRLHRAAIGHLLDHWRGEDKDPESGRLHLAHALCSVMMLLSSYQRDLGEDDRPPTA